MIPWSSGYSAEVWDMKLLIHSSQKEVFVRVHIVCYPIVFVEKDLNFLWNIK